MFGEHVFLFVLSKIGISYKVKKNPALQDSPPAVGCLGNIIHLRRNAILCEALFII